MDSLDQKLAQARERFSTHLVFGRPGAELMQHGFDAAAAIAREVAAEKDAEIARLKAESRKVSDAQRKQLRDLVYGSNANIHHEELIDGHVDRIVAIIESSADAEATR